MFHGDGKDNDDGDVNETAVVHLDVCDSGRGVSSWTHIDVKEYKRRFMLMLILKRSN